MYLYNYEVDKWITRKKKRVLRSCQIKNWVTSFIFECGCWTDPSILSLYIFTPKVFYVIIIHTSPINGLQSLLFYYFGLSLSSLSFFFFFASALSLPSVNIVSEKNVKKSMQTSKFLPEPRSHRRAHILKTSRPEKGGYDRISRLWSEELPCRQEADATYWG